jgi:hypothetical protein
MNPEFIGWILAAPVLALVGFAIVASIFLDFNND